MAGALPGPASGRGSGAVRRFRRMAVRAPGQQRQRRRAGLLAAPAGRRRRPVPGAAPVPARRGRAAGTASLPCAHPGRGLPGPHRQRPGRARRSGRGAVRLVLGTAAQAPPGPTTGASGLGPRWSQQRHHERPGPLRQTPAAAPAAGRPGHPGQRPRRLHPAARTGPHLAGRMAGPGPGHALRLPPAPAAGLGLAGAGGAR
ncbi:hypothetical protein D3C79_663810 [compost metagenome]